MKFTPEQNRAIKTRGCNILVAAGAGSGKTGVLTERIVDRLRDGENIDEVLVLTYTKAAAGEMLRRIREKIFVELRGASTSAEKEHWRKQAMLLSEAPITTLHSFCLRLLKRHYNAIPNLNPNFRVLEPSMALVHLHDVLDAFLEECYSKGDDKYRGDFFSLLRLYGNRLGDDGLKDEIVRLREFGCSQGDFFEWLASSLEKYVDLDFWFDITMAIAAKETDNIIVSLKQLKKEAEILNGPQGYIITLMDDIENLERLRKEEWNWSTIGQGNCFKGLKRKSKDDDEDVSLYIKNRRANLRDYFKKEVQSFFKRSFSSYAEDMKISARDMKTLVDITADFYKRYQDYKLKEGYLEFSDLEQYAYELLRENPIIAEEYKSYFKEILIDEYQDVNPLQEKILSYLTNGKNLFVVGDIKQSIYGFRFADHTIFKNRYDRYSDECHAEGENGLKILLNKNFRSKPDILNTVNFFFCQWMDENIVDLPYGDDEVLQSGLIDNNSMEEAAPPVEVNFLYPPDQDDDPLFDDPEEMRYHGRYIAKRIEEMVASGEKIVVKGIERPVQYGDIAILMRSVRDTAPIIEEELVLNGIPVSGPDKRHFTQCQEVRILLSLLSVLDNVRQDIPLASLMRSPFFSFSEDELMTFALKEKKRTLWDRLEVYLAKKDNSALYQKFNDFYVKVTEWRNLAKLYPVADLLTMIMTEINYESFWSGLPGGKKRLRNIEIFLNKARDFQDNGGGLFDFLRYVNNLRKTGADEVDDSEGDCNHVKIMSIHRSKGLEFPIVFCPGLEKSFNRLDISQRLLLHNKLGFGPKYKDYKRRTIAPTLANLLIKYNINRANAAERLRLFYVAMTRAESKLIFTAALKAKDKAIEIMNDVRFYSALKLPGNLIIKSPDFLHLLCYGLAGKYWSKDLPYTHSSIAVSWQRALNPVKSEVAERTALNQYDVPDSALKILKKAMIQQESPPVKAKISVTELLPQGEKTKMSPWKIKPEFLQDEPSLSPEERGTIFHRFMELLDYRKIWDEASLADELRNMVNRGIFTELQSDAIDISAAAGFWCSSYGTDLRSCVNLKREAGFTLLVPAEEIFELAADEYTVLQGALDMIYQRQDGSWVIIDYKTGNIGTGDADFLNKYSRQMDLYIMAASRLYNIEIDEALFYLSAQRRFLRYK